MSSLLVAPHMIALHLCHAGILGQPALKVGLTGPLALLQYSQKPVRSQRPLPTRPPPPE